MSLIIDIFALYLVLPKHWAPARFVHKRGLTAVK